MKADFGSLPATSAVDLLYTAGIPDNQLQA